LIDSLNLIQTLGLEFVHVFQFVGGDGQSDSRGVAVLVLRKTGDAVVFAAVQHLRAGGIGAHRLHLGP
jgi:hypothetical protein